MEWVNVVQSREAIEDCLKLFGECLGSIFDLSRIEGADSRYLEARANLYKYRVSINIKMRERGLWAHVRVGNRRCVRDRTISRNS